MPSLADELRADQDPRSTCKLCTWLASLSTKEQAEWDAAIRDRTFTHASIFRALARRNSNVTKGSIESHRANRHRQSA